MQGSKLEQWWCGCAAVAGKIWTRCPLLARRAALILVQAYIANLLTLSHIPPVPSARLEPTHTHKAVAMALGGQALALLCGVLCCDYKYFHSGLPDLLLMQKFNVLSACPADAEPEVLAEAQYVSTKNGGAGAVRDVIKLVMKEQEKWMKVF